LAHFSHYPPFLFHTGKQRKDQWGQNHQNDDQENGSSEENAGVEENPFQQQGLKWSKNALLFTKYYLIFKCLNLKASKSREKGDGNKL
jgi:hypothetical protein